MLIFEVTSQVTEKAKATRKYKCTSGPRKGQRVAKPSTCSAPISHRSKSYGKDDNDKPRSYVPTSKKSKKHEKKKIRPKKSGIHTEAALAEYSMSKAKISDLRPGQSATIDNGDGTKTTVDLNKNPQALTKDAEGNIKLNTIAKPGQKPNPASLIKKGDLVDLSNENK